jgi:acetolactate synthase-1/2/3 large subunit
VVIWAGGGVVADDAEAPLRALAERLHAPVVTTWAGRGLLAGHPLLLDVPVHEPAAADLVASADLLLVVGSAFDGMATRNGTAPLPPVRAVINADAGHLGAASAPELRLQAGARLALEALAAADLGEHQPWAGDLAALRKGVLAGLAEDPRTAEAATFLASVEAVLPADAVVVCDMAVAGYWAGSYLPARRPRAMQYPVGWGTLGYALPAAVGPGALGDRPVLVVCGDGGLMFGVGELATLAQERQAVTVLVVDDAGYGMLRFDQDRAGHEHRGVDLHTPDLVELAHAFGIPAVRVDGVGEPMRAALDEAMAARAPRLVTVRAALYPPRTTSPRWHD